MGNPEGTGGKPQNHRLRDFTVPSEQRGVRPLTKMPGKPEQQPPDPELETSRRLKRRPKQPTVFEYPIRVSRSLPENIGEQGGEGQPFQPTPAEQQTPQRQRTQREIAQLAQNRELRSLTHELWGKALRKGTITDTIQMALYHYPDLPPDEALRRVRTDYQGMSFASGEQGGEEQPFQPTPAEQQTPQRRRSRHERARLTQVPQLRELANELFGSIPDETTSAFIAMAVRDHPELLPDQALREYDRDLREGYPFTSGAQREQRQPFQPTPAEQQAVERLGKPPPAEPASVVNSSAQEQGEPRELLSGSPEPHGEQEIDALAPSYLDDRERFVFSYRFTPEENRLPEAHDWDSLAEVLLDFSGYVPKPPDPSIPYEDIERRILSNNNANDLGARSWENHTVKNLEAIGRADLIPQFKQNMQEYRRAVKGIVAVWRERGLL
jgi:hypothetical protein